MSIGDAAWTLDELELLLFLHARAGRGYSAGYLRQKMRAAVDDSLRALVQRGLVAREASVPQFSYGVEDGATLARVDELAQHYHSLAGALRFVSVMAWRGEHNQRKGLRQCVRKPRQALKTPDVTRRASCSPIQTFPCLNPANYTRASES